MQYFVDTGPAHKLVLRRRDKFDSGEVWRNGKWLPTNLIGEAAMGHNDFVDSITEDEARALAPEAFKS